MERKITIEESVPYTEDYQNKMLEENQVEGLLEMHGRGMDDKSCYDYDVSGKVSMKALYEKHTMSGEEIKILLKSILRVVKEVERAWSCSGKLQRSAEEILTGCSCHSAA